MLSSNCDDVYLIKAFLSVSLTNCASELQRLRSPSNNNIFELVRTTERK